MNTRNSLVASRSFVPRRIYEVTILRWNLYQIEIYFKASLIDGGSKKFSLSCIYIFAIISLKGKMPTPCFFESMSTLSSHLEDAMYNILDGQMH